jgi:predicted phosphohydrolase
LKVDFITGEIQITKLTDITESETIEHYNINVDGTSHAGADEKIMDHWWSLVNDETNVMSVNVDQAYKTNKMGLVMEKIPNEWHRMV